MGYLGLWKYCTPEHCREFLLSLRLLGDTDWTPRQELACLYAVSNHTERHYHRLDIPKQDGSVRVLQVPDPLLKRIQRGILHQILEPVTISPHATAYHKGADILTNASPHVGAPLLLKLDIREFFDSINFTMVHGSTFPTAYFPPAVGSLLTHLCCLRERLPQGAPTSAAISNLVMRPFDSHMARWCGERSITYTRYCDDMAFSGDFDPKAVESKVTYYLQAMGFSLNHGKTRLVTGSQRQMVTGVVVNSKPQASRGYRRKLRQEIHFCLKYGVDSHLGRVGSNQEPANYLAALKGKINHVLHINPQDSWFRQAKQDVDSLWDKLIQ